MAHPGWPPQPEVGQLELAHVLPVHHVGMQVVAAVRDDSFDVLYGQLAVPAAVDVHHERTQPPLVRLEGEVGAVDPTTHPKDGVVLLSSTFALDTVDDAFELASTLGVGKPDVPRRLSKSRQ